MNSATGDGGESLSVHQLLQRLAPDYWKRFGPSMPHRHRQVLKKILSCRTPALGARLSLDPNALRAKRRGKQALPAIPATTGIVRSAVRPTPTTGCSVNERACCCPHPTSW